MSGDRWTECIARIVPQAPESLDDLLLPLDPAPPRAGRDLFPPPGAVLAQQTQGARAGAVAVGVRVAERPGDLVDRALRLAAFAVEQDVEVVILSAVDDPGFERFGFRVERIAGDDPEGRAACEDQIRRFWNIDLVL